MPLSGRGAILQPAAPGRGVAAQLARDRRRRPTYPSGDLTHAAPTGLQDRDLLALGERQVAPRQRRPADRRHAATLTKPPDTNRGRHPGDHAGLLARHAVGDRRPEPLPILTPRHQRSTRRTHRRPARPIRPTPPRLPHRNSSSSRCRLTKRAGCRFIRTHAAARGRGWEQVQLLDRRLDPPVPSSQIATSQKSRWISIPMNRTILLPSLSRRERGKGCLSAGVRRWQGSRRGSTSAARTILYDRRMPERRSTGPEAWHARVRDESAVIISRSGLL
jgi:hypothetical protein